MGWWDNIKNGSLLDPAMERLKTTYEKLISHPDYNRDEIDSLDVLSVIDVLEEGDFGIETLIDYLHEKDKEGEKKYGMPFRSKEEINPMAVANWLKWSEALLRKAFNELGEKRSLGLFESMAETFGVTVERYLGSDGRIARFSHRGLEFELHRGGIKINIQRFWKHINICVVDEKKLPVGDFYATMLGLIVARPEELDVVNFGIQLGLIMLSYSGYHWDRTPTQIGIFTPFEAKNSENQAFSNMLSHMVEDDHDLAPDVLDEIEAALIDCFGSTRGFF